MDVNNLESILVMTWNRQAAFQIQYGIFEVNSNEVKQDVLNHSENILVIGWWLRPPTIYDETGAAACNIHCYTVIGFW